VRLTRLVMHGFRSYREPVEVRFEAGVNVFLGRNEAGKTGILLAVQAALYAPRTAAERESLVADGSDVCQVALEYALPDGREFRVCRDLVGHKGSIAECRAGSWLTLATAVGDIAQIVREHTGCDDALFRATLLVRHEAVEVGDADDLTRSLSERIELLVSGSPGGISAARAVKKLETHVKELSGPRAGLITAAETRLREAESLLASANSAVRRLADGRPRLEELGEQSERLEGELKDAEAVLDRARRVAALESRRAELQAGRATIDRTLDARADLARMEAEAAAARARVPEPPIAVGSGGRPHPALPTRWGGWSYRTRWGGWSFRTRWGGWSYRTPWGGWSYRTPWGGWSYRTPWGGWSYRTPWGGWSFRTLWGGWSYRTLWGGWSFRMALLVLGGLLLLGGLTAALLGQLPTAAVLALLGATLAASSFIPSPLRGEGRVGTTARPEAEIEAERNAREAEREAREAERRRDLAEGAVRSLDQRPEAELTAERSRLGRDLEEAEAQLVEAAIHRLEPADLARREVRAQQLPALIRAAVEARIRCEVELQSLENAAASLAELEDEVDVAGRQVDRLRLRLEAMSLARRELDAAISDIKQSVGPELAAAASRALADVAPDYSVSLADGAGLAFLPAGPGGEPLGRRQLSDGTIDQFHFAVRVALADVLLGDLRPPLLLDDPFRYADAERRAALHAMLGGIAEERQVLYFTVEEPAPLPVTHRLPVVASRVGSE
jgi:AAA domain